LEIDWSRLRSLTVREFVNALLRDGFELRRQKGSHQHFLHPDGRRVTVAYHSSGETFGIGILRRMVQGRAKWTAEDLIRLGLLH
jgi:predicted RNA binding protein YcfA (HicA-like mRNA interferase family)